MGKSAEEIQWIRAAEKLPVGTVPAVNIKMGQVGMLTVFKDAALFKIEYPLTEIVYKFDDDKLYNDFIWLALPVDGYREALAELVRLKDIKDELDEVPKENEDQAFVIKHGEYVVAKFKAWKKAKELLASPNQEQGEKQEQK